MYILQAKEGQETSSLVASNGARSIWMVAGGVRGIAESGFIGMMDGGVNGKQQLVGDGPGRRGKGEGEGQC